MLCGGRSGSGGDGDPRLAARRALARLQPSDWRYREGAVLVQSPEEVVELLSGFDGNATRSTFRETTVGFDHEPEELAEAESADIGSLLTTAPVAVDELIRQSGENAASVQLALLELEISGQLQRYAGGRVSLGS
jgi:DNA processing protein